MTQFTISPVPPEQVDAARARALSEDKITLEGNEGDISHNTGIGQVEIKFVYDPTLQAINFTIVKAPPFMSGRVQHTIQDWFAAVEKSAS